jgi:hypothetical protein
MSLPFGKLRIEREEKQSGVYRHRSLLFAVSSSNGHSVL